ASGTIIGASKVARDITERKLQEATLRETNAALTRSNADLEQFAYSASHDLQEPLRMVTAYSEMLSRKFGAALGTTGDEYIRFVVEGVARMEQLLKDLRIYAQISIEQQEPADIEAEETLRRALENLETTIREGGATIVHGTLPVVRMHEFQLQQMFHNLI